MVAALLLSQVLLTFAVEGEGPVRFGFPLPAQQLQRGLRVSVTGARLQWRRLQGRPDPQSDRVWVELSVAGVRGRARLLAGGVGPSEEGCGAVVTVRTELESDRGWDLRRVRWRWCSGEVDELERRTFNELSEYGGEVFDPGESLTLASPALTGRFLRVRIHSDQWRRAGVLPGTGRLSRRFRERLAELAIGLRELPGARGRGDYGRSGGVVTNLEFDTTLGFARLGLASSSPALLARALGSARHLADRDLHPRSGLPYRHGPGHRVMSPRPGHAWLAGLLLVGCMSADDLLIAAARTIAHGLARHPPPDEAAVERARDYGWPLHELEVWLRFSDDPVCRRAADAYSANLAGRWDARAGVMRFGEGERRGFYEERAWITGGILVPALRLHLARRPDAELAGVVRVSERRLLQLMAGAAAGLPIRYRVSDGEVRGQLRLRGAVEGYMSLAGVAPAALMRCLSRSAVRRALLAIPDQDDPDLATSLSIAARSDWVYR